MNKSAQFTLIASAMTLALSSLPASATDQVSKAATGQRAQDQSQRSYGMGPGMMGGGGGYGMGPGMMGGYGMGYGMMGDWGGGQLGALDLTKAQQEKINKIQDETRRAHWSLMGAMMDQQAKLRDLYAAPKRDTAAIDSTYKAIGQMQQQMYDSSINAQKRIEAVLTKEQQEKLKSYWRRSGPGY
ncbi:MAG TPA: periplasmic heavy metal sensor [Sulfuricella sp.]|nr:periplasmic heavy metal sensor [Sulfuricella sp.]